MCRLRECTAPHYLLLCEAKSKLAGGATGGNWTFVLEEIGTSHRIEVAECEPDVTGERLQLLAVVRGLEALEQTSRVTLFTSSRYVAHGIRRNLRAWRENGFRWESFGEMRPIKHRDLWMRIDNAVSIHQVDCRIWHFANAASIGKRQSLPTRERDPARDIHEEPNAPLTLYRSNSQSGEVTYEDDWVKGDRGWIRKSLVNRSVEHSSFGTDEDWLNLSEPDPLELMVT